MLVLVQCVHPPLGGMDAPGQTRPPAYPTNTPSPRTSSDRSSHDATNAISDRFSLEATGKAKEPPASPERLLVVPFRARNRNGIVFFHQGTAIPQHRQDPNRSPEVITGTTTGTTTKGIRPITRCYWLPSRTTLPSPVRAGVRAGVRRETPPSGYAGRRRRIRAVS